MEKIVAVTPAGRKEYLEILYRYLNREHQKGILDKWRLWLNTTNPSDLEYCRDLASNHDWIETEDSKLPVDNSAPGKTIYQFFANCIDPGTIYVRFDDDIVFLSEDALSNLIDFRVANQKYFLVFANIVNNSICGHIHQRCGLIPVLEGKYIGYDCMDSVGWCSPTYAEHVHRSFIADLSRGCEANWNCFDRWELHYFERFSINCFAFFGSDFAKFGGKVYWDEDHWLTTVAPKEYGQNCICGQALAAHYAFFTQRNHLNTTDVLEKYRSITV